MATGTDVDIIVVGGGHAGIEACLACARMGLETLLITHSLDKIGEMSCNPSIGGIGKGQLVREIDALGGEMARAIDETGIQFRILNKRKGPAVQARRAQADRFRYRDYMKHRLLNTENLFVWQAEVTRLLIKDNRVTGVEDSYGRKFTAKAVILATGTFMHGLIHIGPTQIPGGRLTDPASQELPEQLKTLGLRIERFKTGTCPRLDARSINYERMQVQYGEEPVPYFSFYSEKGPIEQVPCYLTYTTPETHRIIQSALPFSPLYTGVIKARGVRYCPSIEDKIVRFPHHERHYIFVEPEGRQTTEVYPNGTSNSLPLEFQEKMIRSIPGLEEAKILKPGYGIEHDYIDPRQLYPSLETRLVENLFTAGQINGTTGYEEAACQGLIAGINATLKVRGKPPLILRRDQAYIGVLIDDLTRKGTDEPYRMLSSRVEHRLALREDNADLRLMEIGYQLGLISEERIQKKREKEKEISRIRVFFQTHRLNDGNTVEKALSQPGVWLKDLFPEPEKTLNFDPEALRVAEVEAKYAGFIERARRQAERIHQLDRVKIPPEMDYDAIPSLPREAREKLKQRRPQTLGEAYDIPGIGLDTINLLWTLIKRKEA